MCARASVFKDGRSLSLVEAFWADSTPPHRRLLLDEAGGRSSGCAEFTFDVFDVQLDFDARTATVTDVLPHRFVTSASDV